MTDNATPFFNVASRLANWNEADAEWLKEKVARAGRQEDVASAAGISRPALVAILNGHRIPRPANYIAICEALDLNPLDGPPQAARILAAFAGKTPLPADSESEHDSTMDIVEIDLAYGMGGTFVDDIAVSEVTRQLPVDWIRQFTRAQASQLVLCKGIGDSMMPTLLDSDVLLVDRSQNSLKQSDRIWVVMVGEVGMVKRLRVQPNGNLLILSDNENVPPMEAVDGEAVLVGRVVAIVRKM